MKTLVYNSSSLAYPHFGVQIEECERLLSKGDDVIFAYCSGVNNTCFKNSKGNSAICTACSKGYNMQLSNISGLRSIGLELDVGYVNKVFQLADIKELKAMEYKGVNIGYGVLSYYISLTDNPTIVLTNEVRKYLGHLLNESIRLMEGMERILSSEKPDKVILFNGRFFETKPVFELCLLRNIDVEINEVIGADTITDPFRIVKISNSLPHDIPELTKRIRNVWEKSTLSLKEKTAFGERFFHNKRLNIETGLKNFTGSQVLGMLPSDWDDSKRNIVIFNSSENEFAAIGEQFDSYAMFTDQMEGIKYILSNVKYEGFHFYLRIHPNLKENVSESHLELQSLGFEFENLTVIPADSLVSSYSLIDHAWKVVVFGSTIGIEAAYWGTPGILLAGALYHDLDALYKPNSKEHLIQLVCDTLSMKGKFEAIQFGYFLLNREVDCITPKFVPVRLNHYELFGVKFRQPAYLKVFGSSFIAKMIFLFYQYVYAYMRKDKNVY